MEIKAGDVVKLKENATFYDGKKVPAFVQNDQWIVDSVKGDQVVIDKNIDGSHAIRSPINATNLIVVSSAGKTTEDDKSDADKKPDQPEEKQPVPGKMKVSEKGVDLIAKFEGCRLVAYICPAGVWTIGYGHTEGVKPGDTLASKEEAKKLLYRDLEKYAGYVNECVVEGKINFSLNQNQFDALTSFVYNCGYGNLQELVTGRNAATIAEKILLYKKAGGRVLEGLLARREEEQKLFLS